MKTKHMGYHGGKYQLGKKSVEQHSEDPRKFQTRTESSKYDGQSYNPHGMKESKAPIAGVRG